MVENNNGNNNKKKNEKKNIIIIWVPRVSPSLITWRHNIITLLNRIGTISTYNTHIIIILYKCKHDNNMCVRVTTVFAHIVDSSTAIRWTVSAHGGQYFAGT